MAVDLAVATTVMNIAVSITALFSGIFIVVIGGLADRVGRVKILMGGFILGIVGSLLVGMASPGSLAVPLLMLGRIFSGALGSVHHAVKLGAVAKRPSYAATLVRLGINRRDASASMPSLSPCDVNNVMGIPS